MDYVQIGQRIRKIRKAQGLSQEELAERVDISVTHMSHIETGNTKLSLPVFVALAAALGVSTDEILQDRFTVNNAISDLAALMESCTPRQAKIITDIAKAAKQSMDLNP